MSFPSAHDIYVWKTAPNEFAFGALYFNSEGVYTNELKFIVTGFENAEEATEAAIERQPTASIALVEDSGLLAVLDQLVCEISEATSANQLG